MKKGATKVLVAVLCLSMVLGTSMSAMAAATVGNTDVKVDFVTGATTVTTSVTTTANEKVTYMVHDAADFYSVTKDNVKYIDQKTINATTDTFTYTTNSFGANDVVYVGGDSLDAPVVSSTMQTKDGLTIKINGEVANNEWEGFNTYAKVTMANAADVTAVTLGADAATATQFAIGNGVLYVMLPAGATQWTEDLAIVNITTATAEDVAAPIIIKAIDLINHYTPEDYGVIDLCNASKSVGSVSQPGHSTTVGRWIFGEEQSYHSTVGSSEDFVEGTYSYTAKAGMLNGKYVLVGANGAALTLNPLDPDTGFYMNTYQALEDDLKAILADINAGVANAKATDNGDGTFTINSSFYLNGYMGKMYLPVSTPLTKTVYVPAAGDYKVLALYNPSSNERCVKVTVNGTTYTVGGTEGTLTKDNGTTVTTYQNPSGPGGAVLDSDVIRLEKGFQEIGISANNASLRFGSVVLVPVDMVQTILDAVNGTEDAAITMTTDIWNNVILANVKANANIASGAKLGVVYLNSDSLLAYAKVVGGNAGSYGIRVNTGTTVDTYEAVMVGDTGAFAIEVQGEGVNMLDLYKGAKVSAFADSFRSSAKVAVENEFIAE